MNKDTLTGILGAAVLVAAMAGAFFYERGQFHEYDAMRPNEIAVLDPEEGENEYQLTFTRSTREPVVE